MVYQELVNNSNNVRFLLQARQQSLKSQHKNTKIGAVLVKHGKVISRGFNKIRHNKEKHTRWNSSVHAEVDCLKKVTIDKRKGCVLYIYREDKQGNLANCMPCFYCLNLIIESKVKYVVFTNSNGVSVIENYDDIYFLAKRY